jgi:hypothetical protein
MRTKSQPLHALNLIFQEIRIIIGNPALSIPLGNSISLSPAAHSDIHLSPVYPTAPDASLTVLHFCALQNDPTEPANSALNGRNQTLNGAQKTVNPRIFSCYYDRRLPTCCHLVSHLEPSRGSGLCDAAKTDDFDATRTHCAGSIAPSVSAGAPLLTLGASRVPSVPSSLFQLLLRLRAPGTRMFPSWRSIPFLITMAMSCWTCAP